MTSRVLLIIGSLFAITLVGRSVALAVSAGDEHANAEHVVLSDDPSATNNKTATSGEDANTHHATAVCDVDPLFEEVTARKQELDTRLREVEEKERNLQIVERRVTEQMDALEKTSAEIAQKLAQLTHAANADIKHLAGMYENMEPEQASVIFNRMDPNFAAGFLRQMAPKNAGSIMANMDADRAYSVTVKIASLNAAYRSE